MIKGIKIVIVFPRIFVTSNNIVIGRFSPSFSIVIQFLSNRLTEMAELLARTRFLAISSSSPSGSTAAFRWSGTRLTGGWVRSWELNPLGLSARQVALLSDLWIFCHIILLGLEAQWLKNTQRWAQQRSLNLDFWHPKSGCWLVTEKWLLGVRLGNLASGWLMSLQQGEFVHYFKLFQFMQYLRIYIYIYI